MNAIFTAQQYVMYALAIAALGFAVFALVDAARHDASSFVAEGKQTKTFWLVVLGVASLFLFATLGSAFGGILGLIAIVAVGVYYADVRPALRPYAARRRKPRGAGGHGPHGQW